MNNNQVAAVVLAAGKGTRMNLPGPKVLVPLAGRPMIHYVMDTLQRLGVPRVVVVVGHQAPLVEEALAPWPQTEFVLQAQQRGTGHAVQVCQETLQDHQGPVLILTGDSPLVRAESLRKLLEQFHAHQAACVLGTAIKDDPHGFGRIVRDAQGRFQAIVEEKDASEEQRRIREVNLSCYVFRPRDLWESLARVEPKNQQGEYYLTDCPGILHRWGRTVLACPVHLPVESISINTPEELKKAEAALAAARESEIENRHSASRRL